MDRPPPPQPQDPPPPAAPGQLQPQPVYIVKQSNGLATASMVLGIIGSILALIPFFFIFGVVLGILAVVFGAVGIGKANKGAPGKGMAVAGLILGALALILAVVDVFLIGQFFSEVESKVNEVNIQVGNG